MQGPGDAPLLTACQLFQTTYWGIGGAPVEEKSEGLCTAFTFLGIELDTAQQFSCLPADKLANFKQRVQKTLQGKNVILRELQELVGYL